MSFNNFMLDPLMETKTPGRTGLAYKMGSAGASGLGRAKGYLQSPTHAAGMTSMKEGFGFGKGFMRYLGPAFMATAAYQGYQEGGVWGATKGVAKEGALWYGMGAAMKAFRLGPLAGGLAAGAGAAAMATGGFLSATGIGLQQLARPYTYDHLRKHAKLEMGTPAMDPTGTVATMRQRSLMAMQNSRVNAMGALGAEAFLLHQ